MKAAIWKLSDVRNRTTVVFSLCLLPESMLGCSTEDLILLISTT